MNNGALINQDSGDYEYYTPIEIVEMAREVMVTIDLDPFSSKEANRRIRARYIYTAEDDALLPGNTWFDNVWMNHPFSRSMNKLAIQKLINEYNLNRVFQACCITFASTSEEWFRPLLAFPQCFIHGRTNYYKKDGTLKKGVTKGSVVTYIGPEYQRGKFKEVFSKIGTVKI